jgi:hypothetical protein
MSISHWANAYIIESKELKKMIKARKKERLKAKAI